MKFGIMLKETGLAYEPDRLDVMANESQDLAFLALNPAGRSDMAEVWIRVRL
ncbi:MAG: hypothetical protein KIT76_01775 [Pseudolabrys sp.]|nr:hypothetical protein [Pseudolabrys sp.]